MLLFSVSEILALYGTIIAALATILWGLAKAQRFASYRILRYVIVLAMLGFSSACCMALDAHWRFGKVTQFVENCMDDLSRGITPRLSPYAKDDEIKRIAGLSMEALRETERIEFVNYEYGLYTVRVILRNGDSLVCLVEDSGAMIIPFAKRHLLLEEVIPGYMGKE